MTTVVARTDAVTVSAGSSPTIVVTNPTVTVNGSATTPTVTASGSSVTVTAGSAPTISQTSATVSITHGGSPPHAVQGVKYLSEWTGTDRTGATDCGTAVQAAIDAWGGTYTIVVDGTFKCTSEKLDLPSGTILEAARWGVDGFTFGWSLASAGNYHIGNSTTDGTINGIKLRGLKITGAGDGTPYGNLTDPVNGIKLTSTYDCEVVGCTIYRVAGIAVHHSGRGNRITDNRILECGRDGISGFWRSELGLSNFTVADNYIYKCGDDGIAVWADSATQTNGTAATVATTAGSASIVGSGTSWSSSDVGSLIILPTAGIDGGLMEARITAVADTTHATLSVPVVTTVASESATYGVDRPSNYVIANNVIHRYTTTSSDGGNRGIALRGAGYGTVTGNTVRETFGAGIEVGPAFTNGNIWANGVVVEGNTVDRGGYWGGSATRRQGIDLRYAIGCRIFGNTVSRSYGDGISAIYTLNCAVSGNTVSESGDYGIRANGQSAVLRTNRNLRVSDNTVSRSYSAGIRVEHTFGQVSGNQCVDNGTSGSGGSTEYGIYVAGNGDLVVCGNRCTDSRGSGQKQQAGGIYLSAAVAGNLTVFGNIVVGNGGPGIFWGVTDSIEAWGNVASTSDQTLNLYRRHAGTSAVIGTGDPEGVITATVGSTFTRTDGGAGSSFYVKESGTGNTGWAAK